MRYADGKFFVPFEKSRIDHERRIVWGIAQTEDPDCQHDLVTYDASRRAFSKWHRNIREMHTDKAIGRAVQVICDPATKQILVGAYISKGAEDAWQKVLDGTYTGFSIGGYPTRATPILKNGRRLRKIEDYVLEELSLVDTPANAKCVVTAITKRGSLLVATDVLGKAPALAVAGDVISLHHEVSSIMAQAKLAKRAKVTSLVTLAKSLKKPEDQIVAVPISAFTKNADGSYTLPKDAHLAAFTKGDLDGDGYDSEVNEEGAADEPAEVDFGQHAENAALMHRDLVKAAGLGDPVDHYEAAIGGGDEEEAPGEEPPADDLGKNASRGKRGKRIAKRNAGTDVAAMFADLAKGLKSEFATMLDERLGSSAPRAGAAGNEGQRIAKGADAAAGETQAGPTVDLNVLEERLAKAKQRRDEIIGGAATTPQERDTLAREISTLEVGLATAKGLVAR